MGRGAWISAAVHNSQCAMEQQARQVPGRKGRGVLYTSGDGYYFNKNSVRKGVIYLKCSDCSVRAVLQQGVIVLSNSEHNHNHPPAAEDADVCELKERLKIAAKESTSSIRDVFTSVTNE